MDKLIFIHIDKTGGTSIVDSLKLSKLTLCKNGNNHDNYDYKNKHFSYKQYCDYLNLKNLNDYFVFTVIRNPFTWIISRYNFLKNQNYDEHFWKNHPHNSVKFAYLYKDINTYIKQLFQHNSLPFPKSQTEYLINNDNQINIDFILRFENIEDDFKILLKKLNKKEVPLNKLNNYNNDNKNINILTEESRNIIYKWYKTDFENFNYNYLICNKEQIYFTSFYTRGGIYDNGDNLIEASKIDKSINSMFFDNYYLYNPTIIKEKYKNDYDVILKEYGDEHSILNYFIKKNIKMRNNLSFHKIGFMVVKPYIILKEFKKMKYGDVICYRDINCVKYKDYQKECNYKKISKNILKNHDCCFFYNQNFVKMYVKKHCLKTLSKDYDNIKNKNLIVASYFYLKKTNYSIKLMKLWLETCLNNINCLSYLPYSDNEDKEFKWHTPEQGILNCVIYNEYKNDKINLLKWIGRNPNNVPSQ